MHEPDDLGFDDLGFLVRADDFKELVLCGDVIDAGMNHALEQFPAFVGGDCLVQLAEFVGDDPALRFDIRDRLGPLLAAVDLGVAQLTGNDIERVDDAVGLDRLRETVEDHQLDLLVERADA